jgi:hypothetical protein
MDEFEIKEQMLCPRCAWIFVTCLKFKKPGGFRQIRCPKCLKNFWVREKDGRFDVGKVIDSNGKGWIDPMVKIVGRVQASQECREAEDGLVCQAMDSNPVTKEQIPPYREGCMCVVVPVEKGECDEHNV